MGTSVRTEEVSAAIILLESIPDAERTVNEWRKNGKMKKQAFNPYLPSWEYIPDGEPYVI